MLNNSLKAKTIKVLRNIEKYTKTDMVYLTKSSFWSLFSQGIGSLCSFFVVLLLANILTKESFGQYRFILSLIPILSIFTLPGIGITLMRSVARGNRVNLWEIAKTKIRWSLLGSLVAFGMSTYYFYNNNMQFTIAMSIIALSLPFVETFYIYSSYYKGKQDFKTSAIYEVFSRIFQSIILIVAALSHNIIVLLTAFFVGQIIVRYFFYKKTVKKIKIHVGDQSLDIQDDTITYGKHLTLVTTLTTITNNMDVLLIGHFLGSTVLAIYYVALAIPKNFILIFNIIPRIAFPKFSQKEWNKHERTSIFRKILLMFFCLLFFASIYALCVPFVIHIFFKAYSASIDTAVFLSLLIILSPLNAIIGQVVYSRKLITKIILLELVSFFVFTLVFLLMYKVHGATGAATALILSELVIFVTGIVFIQ